MLDKALCTMLVVGAVACGSESLDDADATSGSGAGASDSTAASGATGGGGDGGAAQGGSSTSSSGGSGGGPVGDPPPANRACVAHDVAVVFEGGQWIEEACPSGWGCVRGECVEGQCSDECHLGESISGKDCRLYDIQSGDHVDNDEDALHGRARGYEKWLRKDTKSLFHGGIVSVKYTNASLSTVDSVYFGDLSMHTGIYLAAEANRLSATGSWRARKNVKKLVEVLDLQFKVSGDPGMLATVVVPAGDDAIREWSDWDCNDYDRHCNHEYAGSYYDYVGDPSRDMYMGPLLGMPAAYAALGEYDEEHRAIIREDLMVFAEELIRLRTLPVRYVINGAEMPVQQVEMRFFIPEYADFVDGAVEASVSTSNVSDSGDVRGGQEFFPFPKRLFESWPLLSNAPDIPRASSAMMVPAIIQAAAYVTDGVPAYAERRAALLDFYYNNDDKWGNVDTWRGGAAQYESDDDDCSQHYFGRHLAWVAAHTWGLFETDPSQLQLYRDEVLEGALWPATSHHKNAYFSFAYSAIQPAASPAAIDDAVHQTQDFRKPPRVRHSVDSTSKYGNKACGGEHVSHDSAADSGDRPVVFYQWHSDPWLLVDDGDNRQTYPGHDYLIAYWMGRALGHIPEDTAGQCLVWD